MAIGRVAVPDQVMRHFIPREGVSNLSGDPRRCRMIGNADRNNVPPGMAQDHQGIQGSKADSRHDQEVHCGDPCGVVAEEGSPSLGRWSCASDHVFGNGGLAYLDAELKQFTMDARCTLEWIGEAHLSDQLARLTRDLRPAAR
jgi:hypothetical protein